tara:strand:- start:94 stop:921 length:828 start_codon:yes stop_codon:yes gene_type:complete
MKKLIYLFLALLMTSCASTSFYQVYNVKTNQETITKTDNLVFEDENCKISYNLWSNGGNIGFDIYNKTDEKIYVNLNESNFILNGFANDYYKNRTFTTSESKSASASKISTGSISVTGINVYNNIQTNQVKRSSSANISSSVGYAVTIKEDSIIRVPSKTTKRISEYSINSTLIRDCDLFKYPSKNTIKGKSYSIEQSPIIFSNIIIYESKGERITAQNEFYVSEIANYPETEFFEYKYDEYCGEKSMSKTKYYKLYDSDKFYIKYIKGLDTRKH